MKSVLPSLRIFLSTQTSASHLFHRSPCYTLLNLPDRPQPQPASHSAVGQVALANRYSPMGNNTSAAGAHEVKPPASLDSHQVSSATADDPKPSSSSPVINTSSFNDGAITDLTACVEDLSLTRSDLDVHTDVKICNPEKEAPIQINVSITSSKTNEVIRYAGVHFHGRGRDIRDQPFSVYNIKLIRQSKRDSGETRHLLRFEYTAAVVFGVDFIPSDWPLEVRNAVADRRKYLFDGKAKITLNPAHEEVHLDATIACLTLLSDGKAPTLINKYTQICYDGGVGSLIPYTHMLEDYGPSGSHSIGIGRKVTSIPSTHAFCCPEEAAIKLAHGRFIDYKYEMIVSNDLFKGFFRAVFLVVSSQAVIACVWKVDGRWNNKDRQTELAMSDKMAVSIIYQGSDYDQGR